MKCRINVKNFTEEQEQSFSDGFYSVADFDDREESPCPYGCVWCYENTITLNVNKSDKENYYKLGQLYYESIKSEIEKDKDNW